MQVQVSRDQVMKAMEGAAQANVGVFRESLAVMNQGGMPVEMLQAMSLRPSLLSAFGALGAAVYPGGIVARRIKEWIILFVSQWNNCQFCYESHCQMIRALGISDAPDATTIDMLKPDERAAVNFALRASEGGVTNFEYKALQEHFNDEEIVEITFMIGLINCLNIFNNALGVEYKNDYQGVPIA